MCKMNQNLVKPDTFSLYFSQENPLFNGAIKSAQFYYMDKFIILTSGNAFHLFKYHLDPSKSDIKRWVWHLRLDFCNVAQIAQVNAFE